MSSLAVNSRQFAVYTHSRLYALPNPQYTVYSLVCAAHSIREKVYSDRTCCIKYIIYCTHHGVESAQHATSSTPGRVYTEQSVRYKAPIAQYTVYCTQRAIYSIQCTISHYAVCRTQCTLHTIQHTVKHIIHSALDTVYITQ
jgi:hypothetical protein